MTAQAQDTSPDRRASLRSASGEPNGDAARVERVGVDAPRAGLRPHAAAHALAASAEPQPPVVLRLPDLYAPVPPPTPVKKPPIEVSISVYILIALFGLVWGFVAIDEWKARHGPGAKDASARRPSPAWSARQADASSTTASEPSAPSPSDAAGQQTPGGPAETAPSAAAGEGSTAPSVLLPRQAPSTTEPEYRIATRPDARAADPTSGAGSTKLNGTVEKPAPGPTYDRAQ